MSVVRSESPRLQQIKIQSLQAQQDLLNLLQVRHQQWANSTNDPQIKRWHLAIVEQLQRMANQYSGLLASLSLPEHKNGH